MVPWRLLYAAITTGLLCPSKFLRASLLYTLGSVQESTLNYRSGGSLPVFNNLICLSLGSDRPHGTPYIFWKMLSSLLINSINLQTLIIK
ncbi:unnamed protein product, partial [Eruca vesicaria subsp. sativa]|nr:unnamed protein product [Eruca vesicaria subsp. sativa]